MPKTKTPKPARLVFQPTSNESQQIEQRAKAQFLKTPHQWIAWLIRRELAK